MKSLIAFLMMVAASMQAQTILSVPDANHKVVLAASALLDETNALKVKREQNGTTLVPLAAESKLKEASREYIKDHLKAPATAIFSKETICAPTKTPECSPPVKGAKGVVYPADVDAQNSYGALLRTKYQLELSPEGKVIFDITQLEKAISENYALLCKSTKEQLADPTNSFTEADRNVLTKIVITTYTREGASKHATTDRGNPSGGNINE